MLPPRVAYALDAIFRDMVADPSRKTTDLTRLDGSGKYPETEAFYILPSNDAMAVACL